MKKMSLIIATIVVAVVTTAFLRYNNKYHDTPNGQLKTAFHQTLGKHKTVIVFHKKGCSTCEKLTGDVNKLQKMRDQNNQATIVVEYMNLVTRQYFEQYHVQVAPTVLVVQKGAVIKRIVKPTHEQMAQIARE
ncbi:MULTISPECIES: thioredoxin domain-containing protein [Leuconostoc]|uniref:thioredoxin domain-containing protein n=1 Tax=Leuconostoc TaxID=1243 RepID=UPI000C28F6AD